MKKKIFFVTIELAENGFIVREDHPRDGVNIGITVGRTWVFQSKTGLHKFLAENMVPAENKENDADR